MATIFSYSFDTTAKNQLDSGNTADPDAARSDVGRSLDNTTSGGNGWDVFASANNPGGVGGLGYRHYRGDGQNNNSGGIKIILPSSESEIWVRFYMRFQLGFAWASGTPGYTKDHYWEDIIFGHQGGGWGIHLLNGSVNVPGSIDWQDTQGGATGDGEWHCYEYHVKAGTAGNSLIEVWVDNVQSLSTTAHNVVASMGEFKLGENQFDVNDPGGNDFYTDYDDIVISDSGRVGPLEAGEEHPPKLTLGII
jgi:hypothetical protein